MQATLATVLVALYDVTVLVLVTVMKYKNCFPFLSSSTPDSILGKSSSMASLVGEIFSSVYLGSSSHIPLKLLLLFLHGTIVSVTKESLKHNLDVVRVVLVVVVEA